MATAVSAVAMSKDGGKETPQRSEPQKNLNHFQKNKDAAAETQRTTTSGLNSRSNSVKCFGEMETGGSDAAQRRPRVADLSVDSTITVAVHRPPGEQVGGVATPEAGLDVEHGHVPPAGWVVVGGGV
ncbi:hypothetical protein INR49_020601 [Caranx melampygus]|nr:hypothetical protein INR49_020601 [Caranx melampygus]